MRPVRSGASRTQQDESPHIIHQVHRASSSPPRDKRSLEPASNPYESITTALLLSFILLVVAIALATNRRYWISVVLLVVPGLAGNVCSVRRTTVLGGLTVAALVLLYGIAPRKGTVGDW